MDEVEFIQVELPVEEYEMKIKALVEILLKIDDEQGFEKDVEQVWERAA